MDGYAGDAAPGIAEEIDAEPRGELTDAVPQTPLRNQVVQLLTRKQKGERPVVDQRHRHRDRFGLVVPGKRFELEAIRIL